MNEPYFVKVKVSNTATPSEALDAIKTCITNAADFHDIHVKTPLRIESGIENDDYIKDCRTYRIYIDMP